LTDFSQVQKRCLGCGVVRGDIELSTRTCFCDSRGLVIDRDLNADINLARWRLERVTGIEPAWPAWKADESE